MQRFFFPITIYVVSTGKNIFNLFKAHILLRNDDFWFNILPTTFKLELLLTQSNNYVLLDLELATVYCV